MKLALSKAWEYQLLTYPNPAVGCLIVYQNEIVALEAHQKAGTSHAEVLALLSAYETMSGRSIDFDRFDAHKAHTFLLLLPKDFFANCTLFITLEPCSHEGRTPSCASLLSHLKPKKVVIAMLDPIDGHNGGAKIVKEQGVEVVIDICKKEASELLEPFFIWQKRAFVLFKIAQTSNGKIGGGYLSSKPSLTHVHQLRAVCDSMIIGGNTVRIDRPTLNCRFIEAKAPDIIIYSKKDNFDREIPLFLVDGRKVEIKNSLNLSKPSFILVEGGGGMLNALKGKIDWLLQYQTAKISSHNSSYCADLDLNFLFQYKKGIDLLLWSKVDG